jgi:DNA-binding NarL/FixJ family response regulator
VRPRLLIVDDHVGFRTAARALFESQGYEVVGEVADGETAIAEADRLSPGVALLDVHLPGIDGFAVAERLAAMPRPPVVVLTSSRPIADLRRRLAASPAAGFLAKDELSGPALASLM